jgi:hypothetical protein
MKRHAKRLLGLAAVVLFAAAAVVFIVSRGGSPRPPPRRPAPFEPAAGLPPLASPAGTDLGVNVNGLFNGRTYSRRSIDGQLRALRATGATVARSDALWELSEPSAPSGGIHRYDWTFDDQVAGALAAHGLRWLPIVDYAPGWARGIGGQLHSPPRATADYAAFAAALTTRYGRGGEYWRLQPAVEPLPTETYEIWNEPDNPQFWPPAPDPGQYADLYMRARAAIRAVDPAARPIVGGVISPSFVAAMIAARPRLRDAIDGVGIHPYGASPVAVLDGVRAARVTLRSLGLGSVPLYVTEFGWVTLPPGASLYLPARLRPGYIAATLAQLGHTDCGLAGALLYTWVTPERDPRNPEDWYGIHPPQGGTSADTVAFAAGLRLARAPGANDRLCAHG